MVKDANILLSIINTLLRDKYSNLYSLCDNEDYKETEINEVLNGIGYFYNKELNAFIKID